MQILLAFNITHLIFRYKHSKVIFRSSSVWDSMFGHN